MFGQQQQPQTPGFGGVSTGKQQTLDGFGFVTKTTAPPGNAFGGGTGGFAGGSGQTGLFGQP